MSSKLSSGAQPFVPKFGSSAAPQPAASSASLKTALSAGAAPFNPVGKKSSTPSSSPDAATAKPANTTTNAAEVAANSGLSATATPYSPTRTSPTSKGTPAFPSAPVAAGTSTNEGPAAIGQSSKPLTPVTATPSDANGVTSSSPSSDASPFAASSLVVKTPKAAASPSEVPKFAFSWGLICNNHLDPKNYTGVEIRRVGDIEQFWRLWHHVPLFSSKVSTSAGSAYTYHWFKGTIKPSWEDAANAAGGNLTIPLVGSERVSYLDAKTKAILDDVYMSIVMLVTGAAKAAAGCVNGISIKSRNGVALDLWLDTTDAEKIKSLCEAVREVIVPLDAKYEKEKFAYMNNAQRMAAPTPTSGYKGKAAKVEKKIEYY